MMKYRWTWVWVCSMIQILINFCILGAVDNLEKKIHALQTEYESPTDDTAMHTVRR